MSAVPEIHWKSLHNPNYLGAYAFQPGEEMTLTISKVVKEMIVGADGKKESGMVMYFRENVKPLICNSTNSKRIEKLLKTPYVGRWIGNRITFHVERVKAFGETVDAVRVVDKLPQQNPIPCENCGQTIAGSGKFTWQQIADAAKSKYGKHLCIACAKLEGEKNHEDTADGDQ